LIACTRADRVRRRRRDVRREKFLTFRLNRRELFGRECVAAGVGEEAIDDAGNVSDVKCRGGDSCRARVPFLLRQRLDDLADTVPTLKKNEGDRLDPRICDVSGHIAEAS
jgi:hypothetical protein